MPTAQLQYRVDGGALHEDSIAVAGGAVLSLTAASFAGWQRGTRFEIVAFPPDWPCPAGWSTDASSGFYYYLINSGPTGVTPPTITIPDEADVWGKWLFRLTVSGTLKSAKIGVETASPSLGLHDKAFGESTQFGGKRGHVGPEQQDLRLLDAAALASGFVSSITGAGPLSFSPSTGAVTGSWAPSATVPMLGHGFSACPSVANAAGALSFSAGAGALTLDASTEVDIGTTAPLVKIGAATKTLRFPATAGNGAGFLALDNSGNASWAAAPSAGASLTAHYVTDAAAQVNAADVPLQAMTGTLAFASTAVPATFFRSGVAASDLEVARFGRTVTDNSNNSTTSTAARIALELPAAGGSGTPTEVGRLGWQLTSTVGPAASFSLQVMNGGALAAALTVSANGGMRWHSSAYAHNGFRPVFDGSGNLTASILTPAEVITALSTAATAVGFNGQDATGIGAFQAAGVVTFAGLSNGFVRSSSGVLSGATLSSGEVTTALGFTPVTNARTITGATPITVGGDNSAHDLSANRTIGFTVTGNVPWAGFGITGLASIDNSGSGLTLGANTTSQAAGKSGTTWSQFGALSVAGTTALADVLTVTKLALGTTSTAGVRLRNTTTGAGQQYAPALWFDGVYDDGLGGVTQHNAAWSWEPQTSSSRSLLRLYTGTGATFPSSELAVFDNSDQSFGGPSVTTNTFVVNSGGGGFRGPGGSGLTFDGSSDVLFKCYNGHTYTLKLFADGGSTTTATSIVATSTAITFGPYAASPRFVAVPDTPTSTGGAVTFDISKSQNIEHTLTENTTVTFAGALPGMSGFLVFTQPASSPKTVTMPTNGVGVEYSNAIAMLGVTGIVDPTVDTRTVMEYYVLDNAKLSIGVRYVGAKP